MSAWSRALLMASLLAVFSQQLQIAVGPQDAISSAPAPARVGRGAPTPISLPTPTMSCRRVVGGNRRPVRVNPRRGRPGQRSAWRCAWGEVISRAGTQGRGICLSGGFFNHRGKRLRPAMRARLIPRHALRQALVDEFAIEGGSRFLSGRFKMLPGTGQVAGAAVEVAECRIEPGQSKSRRRSPWFPRKARP
jgi:hypothetical protein